MVGDDIELMVGMILADETDGEDDDVCCVVVVVDDGVVGGSELMVDLS